MRRTLFIATLAVALTIFSTSIWSATTRFFNDDPIASEPESQDAANVKPWDIDLMWDLSFNLFAHPGDPTPNVPAKNTNTIDEVPDSSWFTNRILARPVSIDQAVRGPLTGDGPAPGMWKVIRPKTAGTAPGFTMQDSRGDVWFVSFDGKGYPEAATGAIMVANKIFWTLGYWQVENYLISVRPENLTIDKEARIKVQSGKRRPMRESDLDDVFRRSERSKDGSFRAVAGKALPGKVLGGFKYVDTRPDDPNDVIPHEHRRELRALKVFGAWTNLTDMKANNTLDVVIQENGRNIVRHYLQDVGSTFGTGSVTPHDYEEGWEYLFDGRPALMRLITLGFYIRPWQMALYDEYPAIGRFEAEEFDPTVWKPRVPNAAFVRARPEDNFWAARRVMAFSEPMIRSIVKTAQFSDPAAEKLMADVLIGRRNKIGAAYLIPINPIVDFALDESGTLTFENAAVAAGVAPRPASYNTSWAIFDNATDEVKPFGAPASSTTESITAPAGLPAADGTFVKVQVSSAGPPHPSWLSPVDVYFKRVGNTWKLVGLDRPKQ